ncbi:MAG: phosphoglycolate phosphatase [Burkholderiaceae bacterium]|jgi:phosphoglycolate phosphatase|nr:phosphoglycolate phosphatase [Burkholderiaceae bacterium]
MTALILFDFDGTLADTAPDLGAAANRQRTRAGLEPLPLEVLRPYSSAGARGLLRCALNLMPTDETYEAHRVQFLKDYEAAMTVDTCLFDGVPELLAQIKDEGMAWGIVTNKATYLATPIVAALGLAQDCAVLVCGDTTAHSKPHPLPLLHAAQQAGYDVERCLYVGDDLRDIQAAQAAGMPSIAAAYGYCGPEHPPETWQADHCAYSAREMWPAIKQLMR